jgi:hypothetical protein
MPKETDELSADPNVGGWDMKINNSWLLIFSIVILLALSACNYPGLQPTEDEFATAAAETVSARLTQVSQETPIPTAPSFETEVPTPTNEPTLAPTLPPTATPGCTNKAAFVSDVTIPDDTEIAPGADFDKTWRIRNTGTCTWTSDYDLVFANGNIMSGPASTPIPGNVPPGSTVDLTVDLTAPTTKGSHRGDWQLRDDKGVLFGIGENADRPFYVQIIVADPTATPIGVLVSAKMDVRQTFSADLDVAGDDTPPSGDRDFWFRAVSAVEKYISPQNGAEFKIMSGIPDLSDCTSASLSSSDIPLGSISVGTWLCYETNLGHIGRLEIEGLTLTSPQVLSIDFRTWDTP